MQTRISCIVVAMIAACALPRVASANGRFPSAQQLVVSPTDPANITVQTTYGFVETRNAGKDWSWVCEDAALYGGVLDPPIGVMSNQTLIAGVFNGLTVAAPDGCNLAFATGDLTKRFVVDVAVEKADPTSAIAVTSNGLGGNMFDTRLWQTHDNAATWAQAGVALPANFLALTSDVAPSDSQRIYVSGFTIVTSTNYVGGIARSSDRGATWEVVPVPNSDNATGPYIGAIDPNDPNTIYVRLGGDIGKLLVTHDAGTTWTTIFTGLGSLLGFALSPDGKTVLVGGTSDGVQSASTTDLAFSQINSTLHTRCLTWAGDNVYACGEEAQDGLTVGLSHDHGATFEAIHHLSCLSGPLACPADSDVTTKCTAPWAMVSQTIQTDTCPAMMTTPPPSKTTPKTSNSGCSCSTTNDADATSTGLLALALGLLASRRHSAQKVSPTA